MTAFDERPTRHTGRPLHANTQGEVSREWEGNDAAPIDGETQMAPLQLSRKRNKKLKTDRETLLSRERTRSNTLYKTAQSHLAMQSLCPPPYPHCPNYDPDI